MVIDGEYKLITPYLVERKLTKREVEAKEFTSKKDAFVISDAIIPSNYGFSILVNGEEIYSRNLPVKKSLVSSRKILSGIAKAKPTEGFTHIERFIYIFLYNSIKMYKLLFDSDALIKVSKAGFLESLADTFDIHTTDDVYNEVVKQGIEGLYENANKVGDLIEKNKILVIKREKYAKKSKPKKSFGRGEISVFQAYKNGYLVVTDDLSFTTYLNEMSIKNTSPTHLIIALVKKGEINKEKAFYYLENLKPLIRKEIYEIVNKDIEGE